MLKKRGQISIEYLILTGLVVFTLIVPSIIVIQNLIGGDIYQNLNNKKINDFGTDITDNAKQLYYLGLYSKQKLETELPDNIVDLYILNLTDPDGSHFYVGMNVRESNSITHYYFKSDVPLIADSTSDVDYFDSAHPPIVLPECSSSHCGFYVFSDKIKKPGGRTFELETRLLGDSAVVSVVKIT
jgi:hypothetical protein